MCPTGELRCLLLSFLIFFFLANHRHGQLKCCPKRTLIEKMVCSRNTWLLLFPEAPNILEQRERGKKEEGTERTKRNQDLAAYIVLFLIMTFNCYICVLPIIAKNILVHSNIRSSNQGSRKLRSLSRQFQPVPLPASLQCLL